MLDIVSRLQVLACSSPKDKKILVEKLKSFGEIVSITGDGTNDGADHGHQFFNGDRRD